MNLDADAKVDGLCVPVYPPLLGWAYLCTRLTGAEWACVPARVSVDVDVGLDADTDMDMNEETRT